jgi:4-hydroxyproline epimerase
MARHEYSCIDAHTCGNPVRMVVQGGPDLPHVPMLERRAIFQEKFDWVRRALMFEPRGHDVMSGTILYPATRDDCDIAVLFIEVSGYLAMCGHATIGTVTAAIEEGIVTPREEGRIALETPAGRVVAQYTRNGRFVDQVSLANVASYLHSQDVMLDVPGLGEITIDLAYGGNFYAIIEPQKNWPGLGAMSAADIQRLSPLVRRLAQEKLAPVHPEDDRIRAVSHVMWCDAALDARADARNAVFYGDKAIDRSPCGTGSSARMAQLFAKGKLQIGSRFVHESIIGTLFDCRVDGIAKVGGFDAILPVVAGWAQVTGHNRIIVDDHDPLKHGFQIA